MERTDVSLKLKNEAMQVIPELQSEYYRSKDYAPFYPKFTTVKKISDMEWNTPKFGGGSAWTQMTSLIGIAQLYERGERDPIKFVDPELGYPVYVKRKNFAVGAELTMEVNRDFKVLKGELMNWIKEQNFPQAVEQTKELFVAGLINEGGYTAGTSYCDQSIPGILAPSYGKFVYDGSPLFNLAASPRSNKSGSTFYNDVGALSLTYDNLVTADTLMMATNAYREDNIPFNNNLNPFLLVNPALRLQAQRIMNSTLLPGTNNNDINPLQGSYEVIANPYLTNAAAWQIGNKHGIWFYDSSDVMIDVWKVNETKLIRLSASIDLAMVVRDWRAWVRGNGKTS